MSGNRYIVSFIYIYSGLPEAFAVPDKAADRIIQNSREGFNLNVIILASLLVLPILGCRHCNILRFSQVECIFLNMPTCVPVGGH